MHPTRPQGDGWQARRPPLYHLEGEMPDIIVRDQRRKDIFFVHKAILDEWFAVIGPTGFAIYCLLCRMADLEEKAFPGYRFIQQLLHVSSRTLSDYLWLLKEAGLIHVQPGPPNIYYLLDVPSLNPDSLAATLEKRNDPFARRILQRLRAVPRTARAVPRTANAVPRTADAVPRTAEVNTVDVVVVQQQQQQQLTLPDTLRHKLAAIGFHGNGPLRELAAAWGQDPERVEGWIEYTLQERRKGKNLGGGFLLSKIRSGEPAPDPEREERWRYIEGDHVRY